MQPVRTLATLHARDSRGWRGVGVLYTTGDHRDELTSEISLKIRNAITSTSHTGRECCPGYSITLSIQSYIRRAVL